VDAHRRTANVVSPQAVQERERTLGIDMLDGELLEGRLLVDVHRRTILRPGCRRVEFAQPRGRRGNLPLMRPRAELAGSRLVVGRDDRAAHFSMSGGDVLVVADGAGGTGGGAEAAEAVLAAVGASLAVRDAQGWVELLARVD